ncbi:hypothetical protein Dimus_028316 [Dionaea muscipula]
MRDSTGCRGSCHLRRAEEDLEEVVAGGNPWNTMREFGFEDESSNQIPSFITESLQFLFISIDRDSPLRSCALISPAMAFSVVFKCLY